MSSDSISPKSITTRAVLVVDDDQEVRELVSLFLRESGFRVHAASDAEDAVNIGRAHRDIDLVLTDIELPDVFGDELAAWFRVNRPAMPVVFMSGNPEHRRRLQSSPFIDKPFQSLGLILETIREVLARGSTFFPLPLHRRMIHE